MNLMILICNKAAKSGSENMIISALLSSFHSAAPVFRFVGCLLSKVSKCRKHNYKDMSERVSNPDDHCTKHLYFNPSLKTFVTSE